MGVLSDHPIGVFQRELCLDAFVETGTGPKARGLLHALECPFTKAYSCEGLDNVLQLAAMRVREVRPGDGRWCMFHGDSITTLPKLLDLLEGQRVLWWLDAHYPQLYGAPPELVPPTELPLLQELDAIFQGRSRCSGDVFIIDDWRAYGGECDSGPLPVGLHSGACDSDAILRHLSKGHRVFTDRRREGYLVALPDATRGTVPATYTRV